MWKMGLVEGDDYDHVVFEETEEVAKEGIKWLALARIHTTNESFYLR